MLRIKSPLFLRIFIISIIFIQACTPIEKITYLNNSKLGEWEISPIPPKHHLEVGDILIVKVISRNQESNDLFNIETNTNSVNPKITEANLYLNGFTINQEGFIDIPNVGPIYILNQTLEEAEETIMLKAKEYLINPFVLVKLANFEITILGEVTIPGRYPVYKEGITIYEALAMAGDINDYGNLQEVKMIRSNKNKKEVYYLDLTDANILTSDFYYLHNNDLIYIPPLQQYGGMSKNQSQLLLSTLTTLAILYNVYLKSIE